MPIQHPTTNAFRRVTTEQLKPILDVFAQVTWPVPEAEIPALIEKLGWTLTANRVHIDADTHLPLDYPIGDFAKPHGELTYLMFYLTDTVYDKDDTDALAAVQTAYQTLTNDIQSLWGTPTGSRKPQPDDVAQTWWELPTGARLSVRNRVSSVAAEFMGPELAVVERYYESHPREDYPELYEYDGDDSED
ncbi:MAG: DUF6301 family protein [Propionibacteriaceae bacterium]|jgi:hypothetical protein|nr:DUF6301 family protein [Propionibacteriaceae bacterium]